MTDLILNRYEPTDRATPGELFAGPLRLCDTLERGPGSNRVGIDRIPEGRFPMRLRSEGGYHQRAKQIFPDIHRGMVEIVVPGRTYILIHWGNFWTNTRGCILVGEGTFIDDDGEPAIKSSRTTYRSIYPTLAALAENGGHVSIVENVSR